MPVKARRGRVSRVLSRLAKVMSEAACTASQLPAAILGPLVSGPLT
jgi:hypothetical protein